jgi:hypothetical protein
LIAIQICGICIGNEKKNHTRAADKKGFSVALPIELIGQLEYIANSETRSRNKQIEHMLRQSVADYKQQKGHINSLPSPLGETQAVTS